MWIDAPPPAPPMATVPLQAVPAAPVTPALPTAPPGTSTVLLGAETTTVCEGRTVSREDGEAIAPGLYGSTVGTQTGQRIARTALDFRIDPEGRPLDIRPVTAPTDDDGPLATPNATVSAATQATLAGWRFAPGARGNCRLVVRYVPVPVDRAETDLLLRYFAATRYTGPAREAVAARLSGPAADCRDRARLQRLGYPDFTRGPRRPGIQDWTVVRWSIAGDGSTTDIETLGSSGDAGFDTEAREAVGRSRADPGTPRTGCLFNWYRRGEPLPAPPVPPAPADPVSQCPRSVLDTVRFPAAPPAAEAFLSRGVEGWALIRFDISPWGDVGAVAVVEAQPARALGDAALSMVTRGRARPGPGAVRCIQPVLFRVPDDR